MQSDPVKETIRVMAEELGAMIKTLDAVQVPASPSVQPNPELSFAQTVENLQQAKDRLELLVQEGFPSRPQ